MTDPRDVVRQHISAFNRRDNDAEPWSTDALLVAPGAEVTGRQAIIATLNTFVEAFPDGTLTLNTLLTDGNRVTAEGEFRGTNDGPLQSLAGVIPASAAAVTFRWASIYTVVVAELTCEHYFYDRVDLLSQIGLLSA